jgi:hypothetical protein
MKNIRIHHLRETGWKDVEWICLSLDKDWWQALENMLISLWIPQKAGNLTM